MDPKRKLPANVSTDCPESKKKRQDFSASEPIVGGSMVKVGEQNSPSQASTRFGVPEGPLSSVSILSLLEHPFTSGYWKVRQQDAILTQRTPFSRRYSSRESWYLRFGSYPWLCESDDLDRYFCWPCLLFTNPQNVWSTVSTRELLSSPNFELLEEALVDHQTTADHQVAESLFMTKNKITTGINLELWKCLVQTIISEKKNNNSFSDFAVYSYSSEYEHKIKPMMEYFFNRRLTKELTVRLSNVILEKASEQMNELITEEVRKARYVALHIEDLSPVVEDQSWLAVVAKYVDEAGRVYHRVIDFAKKFSNKKNESDPVAAGLIRVFERFKLNKNVTRVSYSATLVSPTDILLFNNSLMKWCHQALFIHPPVHSLHKSLLQAISHSAFCCQYLQHVLQMHEFLSENAHMLSDFPALLDERFAWKIKSYFNIIVDNLQKIESMNIWGEKNGKNRKMARQYLKFLWKLDSRFMAFLLDMISTSVDNLANAVDGLSVQLEWYEGLKYLASERERAFDNLKGILSDGMSRMSGDELLADEKLEWAAIEQRYQRIATVIVRLASALVMQRFQDWDAFMATRADVANLPTTFLPILKHFKNHVDLSDSLLSRLRLSIQSQPLTGNGTHGELLEALVAQHKQQRPHLVYEYLLYAHTITTDGTEFRKLIASVNQHCEKEFLPNLTRDSLDGYFWHAEDISAILENPKFYEIALTACQDEVDQK